jgi:hypothetical protein
MVQASCEVQCGQRFAGIGIAVAQYTQSFVVGAASAGFWNLLAVRTTRNMVNATMMKLITVLRNCP